MSQAQVSNGYQSLVEGIDANPKALAEWELLAIESVGNAMEFWGFKRNYGRVWALLYVRNRAYTALDIQSFLNISKGGVSMILRELESWQMISRVRAGDKQKGWTFVAKTDFREMVTSVMRRREADIVTRLQSDFDKTCQMAKADGAPEDIVERLAKIERVTNLIKIGMELFLSNPDVDAQDVQKAFGIFNRKN